MITVRRLVWSAGACAAALGLLAVVAYALVIRPVHLRFEQVGNLVQMRRYTYALDEYRKAHGRYPASLRITITEAGTSDPELRGQLDRWGHKVLYQAGDQRFLLVSYGRDGKPDGTDYEALRARNGRDETPCRDLDADIIFSDRGEHRTCGK